MDREERQYHAQELLRNPVFTDIFDKLERDAINAAVAAPLHDHSAQQAHLAYLRAIRTFRADCKAQAGNTPTPKAAPA